MPKSQDEATLCEDGQNSITTSSGESACCSSTSSSTTTSVTQGGDTGTFIDIFGVQLEVTSRLLEAERRKLLILQRELGEHMTSSTQGAKASIEIEHFKINLCRIQQQHDQLEREYEAGIVNVLRNSTKLRKSTRSQPAIGIKHKAKARPTIFGTLTTPLPVDSGTKQKSLLAPQMSSGGPVCTMAGVQQGFQNGLPEIDETQALAYEEGNLQAGSLEALIQHIVPTEKYFPDRSYIFAFLLSSRLFIRPHNLLSQVCETCIYQQNLHSDKISKEQLGKFGPHMIQLLCEWTDNFPYDFRDERMMRSLKEITQMLVGIYPELRREVGLLMHNLFSKLSGLQKYEDLLSRINAEVAQRLLNIMPTTDIYEVCPSPLVLAQQLTHIELERLSMIGPEEFVQAFATENSQTSTTFKDMKRTKNLESYVQWFNRLSYFVATEICMFYNVGLSSPNLGECFVKPNNIVRGDQHLKKKNRVKMIEYFIDVAKECINIGNFNSLMAIIAGLNMAPIQRLKKTWGKINTDKFDILEHQMNPTSNFGSYRSSLKAALWRCQGAMDDRERIVIPFFSLLVKDMYFLNEGCANRMPSGDINFQKFWHLAKQITEFITWKQVECPFDRHPPVLNYILTNPVFSENSLALASFECEPPENNYEKERYKQLKEQAGL